MALDPYAPCPCGSGKKFKWCCQPIHVEIDKAFHQDAEGQHESALRAMDRVVVEHPANPEAWGRKAQLLYQNDRVEEAENALQKSFEINPNYPFGHYLRAMFRYYEGEIPGALLLFRKAAELYDPQARDVLAQVYSMVGDCEFKLNNPVAARAAFRIALHLKPSDEELSKAFEQLFGAQSHFPAAARREYAFMSRATRAWESALASATTGRLSDTARAFEQFTAENSEDAAAWFNLGLARAWLGDNRRALEALDRYVALEADETRAAAAWAMGEVLRCGYGMEDVADYREHSVTFQIRNPEAVAAILNDWHATRRCLFADTGQGQNVVSGLVIEEPRMIAAGSSAGQVGRLGAYFLAAGGIFRLWHSAKELLDGIRREVWQRAGAGLSDPIEKEMPIRFGDVCAEALLFPIGPITNEEMAKRMQAHAEHFFEEAWVQRPLRSLNNISPIAAAGHSTLKKKLAGVVQFLKECAGGAGVELYEFDRLRRRLGLLADEAAVKRDLQAAPQSEVGPAATAGAPDIAALGTEGLNGLQVDSLTEEQLEQAFQTAGRLDASELVGRFARALIARPPNSNHPDRYPLYSCLIQLALEHGDTDLALECVNEGEKADCEQNEGKRRNDYELRRGQVQTKRGATDAAEDVFQRLIERVPGELRYRGAAAEAMLSARQGALALRFAEQGLAKAREMNNRDSEEYFKELVAAARKQGQ